MTTERNNHRSSPMDKSGTKIEPKAASGRKHEKNETQLRSETRPTLALSNVAVDQLPAAIPEMSVVKEMYGMKTGPGAVGILMSALNALGIKGAAYRDFVLAMGAELEPKDAIEAMLVTQISVLHASMMDASQKVWDAPNLATREAYDRIVNRLARTYAVQLEQLRRYRSESPHVVKVERVTVNAGGQAIVGNVSPRGGDREE